MSKSSRTASTRRSNRRVVLLAPVPGTSPVHRLWAGTKLLIVIWFSGLLWFYPGWMMIGMVASLVFGTARLAHIPSGVLPSVPRRLWLLIVLALMATALAGGEPVAVIHGWHLGFGGVLHFLRVAALITALLGLAAMMSWTTPTADIVPAMVSLTRPLALLRLPVDEWAVSLALALRAFPLLIEEFQVLYAAYRLRPKTAPPNHRARRRQRAADLIDLLTAAVVVTLRRSDEMGDAIIARGGVGQLTAKRIGPRLADWAALTLCLAGGIAAVVIEILP